MSLVLSPPNRRYESRRLQYIEVLRYSLSSQSDLMLHSETRAQFEQGLAVSLNQLIKNRAACRSRDCLEDIAHAHHYRQVATCLSRRFAESIWNGIRDPVVR